jgi:RHS repeat-associated protein
VETAATDPASGKVVVTNLRLPGQYDERLLAGIGIQGPYYNWNRWYLPSMGRYMELDPIAVSGGLNGDWGPEWYGYVSGNPLAFIDPTGESKYDKFFGLPKKFWGWYHKNIKQPGDPDLVREEAEYWFKEWDRQGRPRPDNKGWGFDDFLDMIVPLPPLLDICKLAPSMCRDQREKLGIDPCKGT